MSKPLGPSDFRRLALSLEGAEEGEHMGTAEQAPLVEELPGVFSPIPGGWGRMGMTHVKLSAVDAEVLAGALTTAWKLRVAKNRKTKRR